MDFDYNFTTPDLIVCTCSIFFLLIYLATNATEESLKKMQFFWTFIISYEYWRFTYNSLRNRKISVEGQTKRYVVYCFFGWIVPALLTFSLGYVLELALNAKKYNLSEEDNVSNNQSVVLALGLGVVVIILLAQVILVSMCSIFVFVQAAVFVYFAIRDRIRSSAKRSYVIVFIKIAYMMNGFWLLVCLTWFFESTIPKRIWTFLFAFQGTFLFFAFSFKKEKARMVWSSVKSKASLMRGRGRDDMIECIG